MSVFSLQQLLDEGSDPVSVLRAQPYTPPIDYPGLAQRQYTNWRREQQAWHNSVALMDQSHHMLDLFVEGPGALGLFRRLAVNSFEKFPVKTAKQFIATNAEGYLIGDGILIRQGDESFQLIGDLPVVSWVQFHIETGTDDVTFTIDPSSPIRAVGTPPVNYRYEIQGPNALKVIEKATGEPVPSTKFFHLTEFQIGGHTVHALRHGMAGQPGYELFGPWADREAVLAALLEAGKEFGIEQVGFYAYFTANLESGWFYVVVSGFFTSESTRAFREWYPGWYAAPLSGSYVPKSIEDMYVTPYDLGYGKFVAFDHDFIGREALEKMAKQPPRRRKVTVVWNPEDVAEAVAGLFDKNGDAPRVFDFSDQTLNEIQRDGHTVGYSAQSAYLSPYRDYVSIAVVDEAAAEPGTEVVVLWGENPETARADSEPHRQIAIRGTVAPSPYDAFARESYRK